jgi:hypothetical protein
MSPKKKAMVVQGFSSNRLLHRDKLTRGRCYNHNFLWFLPIFGGKIGVFLKNQCYDTIFTQYSLVLSKKRQFFGENILKIKTSVLASTFFWLQKFIKRNSRRENPFRNQFVLYKFFWNFFTRNLIRNLSCLKSVHDWIHHWAETIFNTRMYKSYYTHTYLAL